MPDRQPDLQSVAQTNATTPAAPAGGGRAGAVASWADDRLGLGTVNRRMFSLRKVFPDHWSFLLGEIALWSFVVLLVTGVFLTLWFDPSMTEVTYQGSYDQLRGVPMSAAFASTLDISFDVRGGLLLRQMHHWAAHIFIAAMLIHLLRHALTGSFRKPREINWVIGCLMLLLGTVEGFAGYSLPDDLLSGTGLRAADGFLKATPVVGTYLSFLLFGGEFPGDAAIPRLFILHVLLIPGLLVALVALHLILIVYHKHTQWPGPGRTEQNVVGYPFLPVYMAKAGAFFLIVFGVIALMGGLMSINPVWKYGPYDPTKITAGVQPDWYLAWPDGLLRIIPAWETHLWGHTRVVEHRHPDHGRADADADGRDAAAVRRGPDHRRQAGAPPAAAAAQRADPHGVHGRADHLLRPRLGGRRQRHHRGQAAPVHQPDHLRAPRADLRRPGDRVPHHQALVHLPPARGQRAADARLRDGRRQPLARGRLQREAPSRLPDSRALR